jgi:uncharacterized protein YciI
LPLFVLHCIDRPGSRETRAAHREAHIAYIRRPGLTKLAGPMLDEAGQITGSLVVIEADDLAAARGFAAEDPYGRAGVFEQVDVRLFKLGYGAL